MNGSELNLARRPFANLRPLKRVAVFLWLAGVLLLAFNVWVYWRHFNGQSETGERLARIESEEKTELEALAKLRIELDRLDLASLNERSTFVNERIEQRTFSWSTLFDRLTETLPNDVRLEGLTPRFDSGGRGSRGDSETLGEGEVGLEIEGQAKDGVALLALLDSFFAHPSFRAPNLEQEARREDNFLEFNLSVVYRPHVVVEPPAEPPQEEPQTPAAEVAAGGAGVQAEAAR